jgi:molybdopterin/thiamine biosynthesis adenylyltransferase
VGNTCFKGPLSCRTEDVGKPKAEVAAKRVMDRVPGVTVNVHFCKIQDMSQDFYEEFQLFILGLDSIEARRYMNSVACSFLGECQHTYLYHEITMHCVLM